MPSDGIPFDPEMPFPLLPETSHTYAQAQEHSRTVDEWLGLDTERIERALFGSKDASGHQKWLGLPVKSLLTPYTEIRSILNELSLKPGQTIVDLGAGYGRMAFVVGRHHPEVRFVGYEIVRERVAESNRCLARWRYPNVSMEVADLSAGDFELMPAENYFLYDFGNHSSVQKTLEDLRLIARKRIITVVGRGRGSRDTIERHHPWLSQVVAPRHRAHYSLYRSGA